MARNRAVDLTKRYIIESRQPIFIESEIQALLTEPKETTVSEDDDAIPKKRNITSTQRNRKDEAK